MSAELDHVFVFCSMGAPEGTMLDQRGFLEGSPNPHPGQGTANRRFFFRNAYLELLWVNNPAEAQSERVLQTQLWDRWNRRNEGACPFGLVFRPRTESAPEPPFPSWSYQPAYLPSGLSIEVGRDLADAEPLLFYLPFARHRDPVGREPAEHPAGVDRITHLTVTAPHVLAPSQTIARALDVGLFSLRTGLNSGLELQFEGEGTPIDLRPTLPLSFVPHVAAAGLRDR